MGVAVSVVVIQLYTLYPANYLAVLSHASEDTMLMHVEVVDTINASNLGEDEKYDLTSDDDGELGNAFESDQDRVLHHKRKIEKGLNFDNSLTMRNVRSTDNSSTRETVKLFSVDAAKQEMTSEKNSKQDEDPKPNTYSARAERSKQSGPGPQPLASPRTPASGIEYGSADSRNSVSSVTTNTSIVAHDKENMVTQDKDIEQSVSVTFNNNLTVVGNSVVKKRVKKPTSISHMNSLLLRSPVSTNWMRPQWSSARDREIQHARLQIENAPIERNTPGLHSSLFRNVSMFKRSYGLMERVLKVYVYREGEKPIYHQPMLRGIYASEGWFMKLIEGNKQFVTRDPKNAHLFYLPFSSLRLRSALYEQNFMTRRDLENHLKKYVDTISKRYRFWNRTNGADHFVVGCHDWALSFTRKNLGSCIRALCNTNLARGFKIGKDISLPVTAVRTAQNPSKDLGGNSPSERPTLAFFAGGLHGYLRPILLQYWSNKEPDMKIFGPMARDLEGKSRYREYMKSSKYCICAKGYEVHTPRVVESIYYECVPVIISDNYVPPFLEVLDWESFAVFVLEEDIPNLRNILLAIPEEKYLAMQHRVKMVQQHFLWNKKPVKYDLFHMILHSIWYNRVFQVKPVLLSLISLEHHPSLPELKLKTRSFSSQNSKANKDFKRLVLCPLDSFSVHFSMENPIRFQKLLLTGKRRWLFLAGMVAMTHLLCQTLMLPYGNALLSLLPSGESPIDRKYSISYRKSYSKLVSVGDIYNVGGKSGDDSSILNGKDLHNDQELVENTELDAEFPGEKNMDMDEVYAVQDAKGQDDEFTMEKVGETRHGLSLQQIAKPSDEIAIESTNADTIEVTSTDVYLLSNVSLLENSTSSVGFSTDSPPSKLSDGEQMRILQNDESHIMLKSNFATSGNGSVVMSNPVGKKMRCNMPPKSVTSFHQMDQLLARRRRSSRAMRPNWASARDQEILAAKLQIGSAVILKNDRELFAPLFRNVSMFKRSYELMERTLKVYVYKDGEKPIFHQPILKGLYASEGWFMKLMEGNKRFVVKDPRKAHLFYMPFSSRLLEHTLYVRNSHNRTNLRQYLKKYSEKIAARYPFWNRTGGADHFLVACHDWAPYETRHHMEHCIKALCNADVTAGFKIGRDVSLPETYVRSGRNPLRDLGGMPPSKRHILAFYAGNVHGYLRPILLKHWKDKDPDMKIFGPMPPGVASKMNYIQHMKTSKYCICPKGYEVNSPRVVEAIFYECVPIIISDNFVPPFFEVLNWEAFSVVLAEKDIPNLKDILLSIPEDKYLEMQLRVRKVQRHFLWHANPVKYDLFHMTLHSIWYNRVFQIKPR
ncbi:hypothetical protein RJ640_027420 [Escallonia rubra]|uniref:Exostosin GT47 domain-containing protein n=1 Tax=Escallonia rubra TaxID=112253 RepID=A0AA88RI72_9ASTE|nr:hypothetical protein RJ640_027420 [Escallonia rubra]